MRAALFVLALFSCVLLQIGQATIVQEPPICNSDTLGDSICEKFDQFDGYQYATCLTSSYIQEQSDGFLTCSNSNNNILNFTTTTKNLILNLKSQQKN